MDSFHLTLDISEILLGFQQFAMMYLGGLFVLFCINSVGGFAQLFQCINYVFHSVWEIFRHYFFKNVFCSNLLSCGTPNYIYAKNTFDITPQDPEALFVFFSYFFLASSDGKISIDLCLQVWWFLSSAIFILQLVYAVIFKCQTLYFSSSRISFSFL